MLRKFTYQMKDLNFYSTSIKFNKEANKIKDQ